MEYSYRYVSSMTNAFRSMLDTYTDVRSRYVTLSKNNAFNKSMVLDISNLEDIEIPTFIRGIFEKVIFEKEETSPLSYPENKIVVPLYTNCPEYTKRTADSIIQEFYTRVTFSNRLRKIITNKGEIYYGNLGIIFNKDFVPILMNTLKCKKSSTRNTYYKCVLHVHPSVFLSNGLIEKSIVKKIIPFYITHTISNIYCYNPLFIDGVDNDKPLILIDEMDGFISTPTVPSILSTEESLNKCIQDNIDEVLLNL